jgi:hypothetical protein
VKNFIVQAGMMVVCQDNEQVETFIKKDHPYVVLAVSHRGALIKVEGVSPYLATSRFRLHPTSSGPMELANASNS